jgi:transposase
MIQITPHMRILVCVQPVDFRKGIDGLHRIAREARQCDPFSGTLFVFCNKQRTALRVLAYDGQGFWLCHKRLSKGRFRWIGRTGSARWASLAALELQMLLWNSDLSRIDVPAPWREIQPGGVGCHTH